jgi:hypothetical protein
MDWNFNIDDFERLLKEKSDEFRMYPSKRVWHSIYNNFHPSRKWPSVVMSVTLIASLLLTGYLNTKTVAENKHRNNSPVIENTLSEKALSFSYSTSPFKPFAAAGTTVNEPLFAWQYHVISPEPSLNYYKSTVKSTGDATLFATTTNFADNILAEQRSRLAAVSKVPFVVEKAAAGVVFSMGEDRLTAEISNKTADNTVYAPVQFFPALLEYAASDIPGNITPENKDRISTTKDAFVQQLSQIVKNDNPVAAVVSTNKNSPAQNKLTIEQKAWIENYALYNRPAAKNWKGKLAGQLYITPSVVYRNLYSNVDEKKALRSGYSNRPANFSDVKTSLSHTPSYGFEIGAGLQYSLFKWVKIRTGLQVNYTRYNVHAFDNGHPYSTSITMVDENSGLPYEAFRSTPYTNIYGLEPVKLHNQTLQVSVPIGIDLRLGSYNKLEWYIGSSIQPSLAVGGKSFLISSDRKNYVGDKSMLNRLNINAGFEAYVTYKTENGYTLQFGPQYRTQLFSNNIKSFSIGERIVNYGFKVGVSKKL